MPEGVTYTKRADAEAYAKRVGGTVVPVKKSKGAGDFKEGYNVIEPQFPGEDEVVTRGPPIDYKDSSTRNMGGMVEDELGYMNGGVIEDTRGPIRYSKGGAVKGKTFRGSY